MEEFMNSPNWIEMKKGLRVVCSLWVRKALLTTHLINLTEADRHPCTAD